VCVCVCVCVWICCSNCRDKRCHFAEHWRLWCRWCHPLRTLWLWGTQTPDEISEDTSETTLAFWRPPACTTTRCRRIGRPEAEVTLSDRMLLHRRLHSSVFLDMWLRSIDIYTPKQELSFCYLAPPFDGRLRQWRHRRSPPESIAQIGSRVICRRLLLDAGKSGIGRDLLRRSGLSPRSRQLGREGWGCAGWPRRKVRPPGAGRGFSEFV